MYKKCFLTLPGNLTTMPGHVKKNAGPDEDPAPYLIISMEMKREDAMKPYDSKKSYWCPDGKGNFLECMLDNDDGTKAVVMCGHEVWLCAVIFFGTYLDFINLPWEELRKCEPSFRF